MNSELAGAEFEQIMEIFTQMMVPLAVVSVISIASAVMLALCVYYDAASKNNSNAVLWAVLSGVFGVLVAIIYVIVQAVSKPKTIYCVSCGNIIPSNFPSCPVCGAMAMVNGKYITPEQKAKYTKRRTLFLVLFIVSYVIVFVVSMVVFMNMFGDIMEFVGDQAYEIGSSNTYM